MRKPTLVLLGLALAVTASAARAGISGSTWQPIGPDPIQGFFNGGVVGRATAIAVNPSNGDQIWLGTASGGVWYSGDGGFSWSSLSDSEIAPAIGAIALDGCDAGGCQVVFVGTGENAIRRDTYHGRGLLVGTLEIPGPPPVYAWTVRDHGLTYDFRLGSINDIQIATGADAAIYLTLSSGVTTSSAQTTVTAPQPGPGYGVYKSGDGGVTWSRLTVPGAEGARPTDLELATPTGSILYVGFMGVGAFKSTDGGSTWCPLTEGIPVPDGCEPATGMPYPFTPAFDWVEIAVWAPDPDNLYVSLGHCPDPLLENCMPSLYKSIDAGQTWTRTFTGTDNRTLSPWLGPWGYSRYTHALAIHPDALHTVYIGAIRLFRTQNSGASWINDDESLAGGSSVIGNRIHDDHHEVVFDPTDSGRLYQTNDGGFAARDVINTPWRPGNAGLQITGFQSITASPLTSKIIGGTQDNNAIRWSGSKAWELMPCCGDAGFTVIDVVNSQYLYAGSNSGVVMRSCDGGGSWHIATGSTAHPVNSSLPDPVDIVDPHPGDESRAFYAPLIQDRSSPYHLYWGGQRLYEGVPEEPCGEWTVAWTPVSPALETGAQSEIYGGEDVITAIAVAPSNPGRIYIGYYGGGIYRTDGACDDPSCWTSIGSGLPDSPISRIAVHPSLPDTLLVTLSGWQLDPGETGTRVYRSTDGGATWAPSGSGVPAGIPANTIHYEPGSTDVLWLGIDANPTGHAVYRSADGGATWQSRSDGLPNVPVYDIALDPLRNRAFAGTHGRGAWILGQGQAIQKESWQDLEVKELPFSGWLLPADATCTVELLRGDGTPCASGETDAMGAEIRTDADGTLITNRTGYYRGRDLAWACHDGICVGGTPASACWAGADPARRLSISCAGTAVTTDLTGPVTLTHPPAVQIAVNLSDDAGQAQAAVPAAGTPGTGSPFDLGLVLGSATGASRSLCTVRGEVFPGETNDPIVTRLADAINASAACAEAGVSAGLQGLAEGLQGEDLFPRHLTLAVDAPLATGSQIVPVLSAFGPRQTAGAPPEETCFNMLQLGIPMLDQLTPLSVTYRTAPGGAGGGGTVRQMHQSALGVTRVQVDTLPGETGDEIAASLAGAFLDPNVPATDPDRAPRQNLFDVTLVDSTLRTVASSSVQVCLSDPGVGILVSGADIASVHPVAVAVVPTPVECTSPAGASLTLDGSGSGDPDSTPGTNDDIVSFDWYEDYGLAGETLLGSGDVIMVPLGLGSHAITLRVADSAGLADTDTLTVDVVDTTPPSISGSATPPELFPPHHGMIPVAIQIMAGDLCSSDVLVSLTQAVSSEPDDAPGPQDGETTMDIQGAALGTTDLSVDLRAERDAGGTGRTYTLTYQARDETGNAVATDVQVPVPLDRDGVVEPVVLQVVPADAGTVLQWTAVPGAHSYNVIRGQLGSFMEIPNGYDLGMVDWIEYGSTDTDTSGNEDPEIPAGDREVFFYLVEYINACCPGYGTESAPRPRIVEPPDPVF